MADVLMPRLSDSMEEGTILRWLKRNGEQVARGEELAEIETDKATMTYESDVDGILEIVADEGETLPVGGVIARVGAEAASGGSSDGDAPSDEDGAEDEEDGAAQEEEEGQAEDTEGDEQPDGDDAEAGDESEDDGAADDSEQQAGGEAEAEEKPEAGEKAEAEEPEAAERSQDAGNGAAPADQDGERVKASPIARRIAGERGVDLAQLTGSGPGGRIVRADVEEAVRGQAPASKEEKPEEAAAEPAEKEQADEKEQPAERKPEPAKAEAPKAQAGEAATAKGDITYVELTRTQQVVARRMAESKATIPDFSLTTVVDMEEAVALREKFKALDLEATPSYNDMVVKAAGLALREAPRANGSYKDGRFELHSRVNVGIAVAAQDSLVVPTIFDADVKSLGAIARDARSLAAKVREGKVTPPDLSGGTFTVSNLGMYGVTHFTAVINPPQAAILAVGAMSPQPVVRDGEVVVRNLMSMTLVCDHRILYGADAAEFLARMRELLESPAALSL